MSCHHSFMHNGRAAVTCASSLMALVWTVALATADTITVCWDGSGDYVTIQEGIDAAVDGDEVVVCDGVYTGEGNKNLDFRGKAITVRSTDGPENCLIDCLGSGTGVAFINGENEASVFDGFTITNGDEGAISCVSASPTILDCVVTGNWGSYGTGISCYDGSSPTVSRCSITDNVTYERCPPGAGIYCDNGSNPTISHCTIAYNLGGTHAGGVGCVGSSPTIKDCVITGNSGYYYGGAISSTWGSDVTIVNCMISGNTVERDGGGVYCGADSSATLTNCTLVGNLANSSGGAIYCAGPNVVITNCLLWADASPLGPELAVVDSGTLSVAYSDVQGGRQAVYVAPGATLDWGDGNLDADPAFAFLTDFHVMGGSPCIDAGTNDPPGGLPPDDLDGNARPLDGDGDSSAVADIGAYEFNPDAPSIAIWPTDFDFLGSSGGPNPDDQVLYIRNCGGQPLNWEVIPDCSWLRARPHTGQSTGEIDDVTLSVDLNRVDRGVHHCQVFISDREAANDPRIANVTLRVSGVLRVPGEYPTIQSAIDDAVVPGDVVLVADGTYTGPGNQGLNSLARTITICSENGPDNCIIDCGGTSRAIYLTGDGSTRVTVDGFTFINGRASSGGAVYCASVHSVIRNCIFSDNTAGYGGAAVHSLWNATIENCLFIRNTVVGGGGAVRCGHASRILNCTMLGNLARGGHGYGGAIHASGGDVSITDCVIADNAADRQGGAIYCEDVNLLISDCVILQNRTLGAYSLGGALYAIRSSLRITNCAITGNSADFRGGGVYFLRGSLDLVNTTLAGNTVNFFGGGVCCAGDNAVTMSNCALTGNTAHRAGGAVYADYGSLALNDCTIAHNVAENYGGAIAPHDAAVTLANCILWGNSPDEFGDADGPILVRYSDVAGGWPGYGNIDADPLFVDPDNGDFHLAPGSPCIDAGCNWAVAADVTDLDGDGDADEFTPLDLDGEGRFFDDPDTEDTGVWCPPVVDMGAYEFGGSGPQPCLGDLDCDRHVGESDLAILLAAWGISIGGDLNWDGVTDQSDLGILLSRWGQSCP